MVLACGVCHTDLHVVDGELPNPTIPIVPGHEIVGRVEAGSTNCGIFRGRREDCAEMPSSACRLSHDARDFPL